MQNIAPFFLRHPVKGWANGSIFATVNPMAFFYTKLKFFHVTFSVDKRVHEKRVNVTVTDVKKIVNHTQGRNRNSVPVVKKIFVFRQIFFFQMSLSEHSPTARDFRLA